MVRVTEIFNKKPVEDVVAEGLAEIQSNTSDTADAAATQLVLTTDVIRAIDRSNRSASWRANIAIAIALLSLAVALYGLVSDDDGPAADAPAEDRVESLQE